ncbi:carbohydrate ABC transporter permease [Sinomonas sp.]|jgi:multiple sugar transport system permease protein|uniref:carbohydrate ABC transporter permease n=1 Tax=Sinomonas sp. TaxID=1914986 RepID=UPI003FA693C8
MTTEAAPHATLHRVTADATAHQEPSAGAPGPSRATARGPRRPRGSGYAPTPRQRAKSVLKHAILIATAVVMIYPLLWMIVSSFRPSDDVFRAPGLWLTQAHPENYANGWNALTSPFATYLLNSTIVVLGAVVGNLVSCSMAAYAFARLDFRGKKWMFAAMLVTIMLPIHVVIVPQYILFSQLGWINTFAPLIVPKFLATDAFFTFLMVQFIRGIPRELDEAARIDGAGHPRIFLRVILPLMTPALATTTIFTFIWTWSDFFSQLIYLTSPDVFTVPVALRAFVDAQSSTDWGAMFAMSVVSLLPVFIAFLIGQKFLVKGIATTGIK